MRAGWSFLRFWYDFIVGDDVIVAAGVVLALAGTAMLARHHVAAWWLLPTAVIALLGMSLTRVARASRVTPARAVRSTDADRA
jgi:hypothetical protein